MEGENNDTNKSQDSLVLDQKDEAVLLEMEEAESRDNAAGDENGGEGGEDEENVNNYKEEENGDKEENEFVVWADDAEEMEDDKRKGDETSPKTTKTFGIEMSKDTDELLVTWNGKEIKVPCKEEVARDLRYHNRQLHLVAYPVCWQDLEDAALKQCLAKATNIALEVNHIQDDFPGKGYLRVRFNTMADVKEVREALEALPPLPKTPESTTTDHTTTVEAEAKSTEADMNTATTMDGGDAKTTVNKDANTTVNNDAKTTVNKDANTTVNKDAKTTVNKDANTTVTIEANTAVNSEANTAVNSEANTSVGGGEAGVVEGKSEGTDEKMEEGGGDDKKVDDGKEVEVKVEWVEKIEEGDKKEGDSGEKDGVGKEGEKVDESKRNITIVLFSDNVSESKIMLKFKAPSTCRDAMTSRLLYVAYSGIEVSERELSSHFEDCTRVIMACRDNKSKGYAYIEYNSQAQAKEALSKFRETPVAEWFVIEAVNQGKAEIGLLKDELRSYWLEQIRALEVVDRTSKSTNELTDLDQKLVRYKKRIITDNTKRQDFGFVIADSEMYILPKEEMENDGSNGVKDKVEKSRERNTRKRSTSRRRSRSRRRRSPPRFQKFQRKFERGRPGLRSGGSTYGGVSSRRTSSNSNEGGLLVNQLQQLVGALSNNMSQQMAQNINRNFSSHGSSNYNNNYNSSSQFNNTSSSSYNRSSLADDRSRFGGGMNQRSRFDDYDSSDRKRRYDGGDRYSGRYNQDYRGYRGNGSR